MSGADLRSAAPNAVLFSRSNGNPVAVLLSASGPQGRRCIFTIAPHVDTFDSLEGQVLLSDGLTEYELSLTTSSNETCLEFDNQSGWHFVVRLDGDGKGHWLASKDAEILTGPATDLG